MKIPAISFISHYSTFKKSDSKNLAENSVNSIDYLPEVPADYQYNISFGASNSKKLKVLFSQNLPCMYSGVPMIEPRHIHKLQKSGVFKKSISEVFAAVKPLEKCLLGVEKQAYNLVKEYRHYEPKKNFQEIFRLLEPQHKKLLLKKQKAVIKELRKAAKKLPEAYQDKFKEFMKVTRDKLNDKPVIVPFSGTEFKYKLEKIKADIHKTGNAKDFKVLVSMTEVCKFLAPDTESANLDQQIQVVKVIDKILKSSSLSKYEPLKELIKNSKQRLNGEKILMPFGNKAFQYDLATLLEDLPDEELKQKLLDIADTLPKSSENISAYITKFAKQPSEKIVYRILWPNIASVEHIQPKSKGGEDELFNYGGAGARENADRGNIDFAEQIIRRPNVKKNCQKYVNKLIELANKGFFHANRIDVQYIRDFKRTIENCSKGQIVLDISKLKC